MDICNKNFGLIAESGKKFMTSRPKPRTTAIGIRVDDEIKRAVEAAAAADARTVSSLLKKALLEYLRSHGFLLPVSAGAIRVDDLNGLE
jgi:hypothetical protein